MLVNTSEFTMSAILGILQTHKRYLRAHTKAQQGLQPTLVYLGLNALAEAINVS